MKTFLHKIILLVCFVSFFTSIKSQNIFSGEPVQIVGQFNGYSTLPYNSDYRTTSYRKLSFTTSTPTDGRGQWATTINLRSSGGDAMPINMSGGSNNGILFISGPIGNRFQNKWAFSGVGQGIVNGVNNISAFNSGNDMGLNMNTAGYYTFVFNDCGYTATNGKFFVGFTTSAPVSVNRANQTVNNDGSATIGITSSSTLSAQENIFIRYTLNSDFSSANNSNIVQATGSGTSYTAIIPTQTTGSVVRYYIFTSTKSLSQLNINTEIEKSISAIKYDDNSNGNYSYIATVLAFKLATFDGKNNGLNNILHWINEDEINVNIYEIFRSPDGLNFKNIGQISKKNKEYFFTDNFSFTEKVFYQLAIIDIADKKTYSNIISIKSDKNNNKLIVFPNPSSNCFVIQIPTASNGNYDVSIINNDGKILYSASTTITDFVKQIKINTTLKTGNYTLVVNSKEEKYSTLIFIQ